MDPQRFDRLARSLTSGGSRRRVLAGLLAGALGSLRVGATAADESAESGTVIADASGGDHNRATATDATGCGQDRGQDDGNARQQDDDNATDTDNDPQPPDPFVSCEDDPDSTGCCARGRRCLEGECVPAYATIPDCGGRCGCPGCAGDTAPVGPTACSASGVAPCSACDPGCLIETNCDFGEFTFIAGGPRGSSYYCTCTPEPDPDATCPPDFEPVCAGGQCWPICDDP